MKSSTVGIIVIILVIAGYLIFHKKTEAPAINTGTNQSATNDDINTPSPAGDDTVASEDQGTGTNVSVGTTVTTGTPHVTKTVTYTDSGFSPSSITINAGDTVRFVNSSGQNMWVASDPHPQHTNYSAFDARRGYTPGSSYSFTFTESKTYTYHDHLHAGMKGLVVVQ